MRISILGAGAWGTALAVVLGEHHDITLWGRDEATLFSLHQERENHRYLPGIALPGSVCCTHRLEVALNQADLLLFCAPLAALAPTLERCAALATQTPLIWACKGIDPESGQLPHQIVQRYVPASVPWGALSGPSFAAEVAAGLPTALTLASHDAPFAHVMASLLHSPRLRLYSSHDLTGVEVAGALKNVIAIASGLADGMELGFNARAALITRGLAEVSRLGEALGGHRETFMGLAGLGDMVLTCTGPLSRNYQVGQGLAQGVPLAQLLDGLGHVAEGVPTTRAAMVLAQRLGVDMPITGTVHAMLEGTLSPGMALEQLLARQPRHE